MGFSLTCLIGFASCVVIIFVQVYGELIVMRHPISNDKNKLELTCLAEDDNAALIWNYNPQTNEPGSGQNNLADFRPKKPNSKSIIDCGVWNSTNCIALWDMRNGWNAVNSSMRPIGPVHDFRWEEFKEVVFEKTLEEKKYFYVGEVSKPSGTAVFSARGPKDIYVYLCKHKTTRGEGCLWIILGGWEGKKSAIRFCPNGTSSSDVKCEDLRKVKHEHADIINEYEWRTFTLKWDNEQKTIKVFRDYDLYPFLEAIISKWHSPHYISVRGEKSSRMRFHFYEYFRSEQKNAELSTEEFHRYDNKSFCAKLLAGLCPKCKLNVTLLNTNGHEIKVWEISGNKNSSWNTLLTWQSVNLSVDLGHNDEKSVRLMIRTILDDGEGRGQWAIDNFRICNSDGGLRESTRLISRPHSSIPFRKLDWSPVKCQKLSINKSIVVDSFSNTKYGDTSYFRKFLHKRKQPCGSACATSGRGWFICDETHCTCDRGFRGTNCEEQCADGLYGYNCEGNCGSCNSYFCNKTTGYCREGCEEFAYIPPFCKTELKKPTIMEITDTTVRVFLKLEPEEDVDVDFAVSFIITDVKSGTDLHLQAVHTAPSMYEAKFENLIPDTRYSAHTSMTVNIGSERKVESTRQIFTTQIGVGKPCFGVIPGEKSLRVDKIQPELECGAREDPKLLIRVSDVATKNLKCNFVPPWFPYTCVNLTDSTKYEVSIFKAGALIFRTEVWTLELAPSMPEILGWTDNGHGIIKLEWKHPVSNSNIKQFDIHIKRLKTELQRNSVIQDSMDIPYPVKGKNNEYSIELHLQTSTVYKISIVAINQQNSTSVQSSIKISISGNVSFANGEKLRVTQTGTIIAIKTPTVINATVNTRVSIIVKDITADAKNQSRKWSTLANMREWIADEYTEGESKPEYVSMEIQESQEVVPNCTLHVGGTYIIEAIVKDLYSNSSSNLMSSPITIVSIEAGRNLAWLVIFPIIVICLSLLVIWHRKRTKAIARLTQDTLPLSPTISSTANSLAPSTFDLSTPFPNAMDHRVSIYQSTPDVVSCNTHSCSVGVEEFEEYAKEAMASGLLDSQFARLSIGPTKKCKYGKLPENLPKNRYKNLIPYDDTRVILKKIPANSHSDYINASYIRGYRKERGYIATQGPKSNTVNDFWRMVWQEKVQVICMLTNVTEGGETSCEQYWPEMGNGIKYGDIDVANADHQVFADYTIRNLNLCYKNNNRKITHLQYTGWPDHGVPMYSQSLVVYLKKLLATPTGKGPVIVHCSAGIGRTGTIILCDICLRQAVREKIFDLPTIITRMREDRANMVENAQQYLLAHLIIMESMVVEQTQIPCNCSLPQKIKNLREQLPFDIQRLKDAVWQDRALHSLAEIRRPTSNHVVTNKLPEFVPATPIVPQFNQDWIFDSESNYINAVSVDGVKMKKQYLESELPTSSTITEYWRLIAEKRIELILILQTPDPDDPMYCNIISKNSTSIPVPYIQVETKSSVDEQEHFQTQRLLMTDISEKKRQQTITVLTCTGWGTGINGEPPTAEALVSLWMASEKISRKEAPTLVLCHDGVTACGLYLALSFLLERMAVERECDVISAVRAVRRFRTEFVQSLEQFEYLYDAAVNYFECFQTYANFS